MTTAELARTDPSLSHALVRFQAACTCPCCTPRRSHDRPWRNAGLPHCQRTMAVLRCALSLRVTPRVALALEHAHRATFTAGQRKTHLLRDYKEQVRATPQGAQASLRQVQALNELALAPRTATVPQALASLQILAVFAMEPPLHRSLVRRWMQRTCHTLEVPTAHCSLLLHGTVLPAEVRGDVSIGVPANPPRRPHVCGRVRRLPSQRPSDRRGLHHGPARTQVLLRGIVGGRDGDGNGTPRHHPPRGGPTNHGPRRTARCVAAAAPADALRRAPGGVRGDVSRRP